MLQVTGAFFVSNTVHKSKELDSYNYYLEGIIGII